jgi:hypothetical protein
VPLNLYVLGDNPFGESITAIHGKHFRGKVININRINTLKNLTDCHILFISSSEKWHITEILRSIKGMDILTIGDTDGFAQKGVIINFYTEEQRVRFEINLDAAKRANLTISSRLLSLSRVVRDMRGRGEN